MARWELALQIDRQGGRPLALQIASAIAAEIRRGRLRPGDRLAGSRALARLLGVHRQTVVVAFDELIAEGWLVSRRTAGTFVAADISESLPARHTARERGRRSMPERFALSLDDPPNPELPASVPPGALLMSGSRPDVRLLPADLIGRAYRRALRKHGPSLLSYAHPSGQLRLRQGLAAMLSATRGLAVDDAGLLVTRGSQMALALCARALVRPGDAVAVEDPGYRPAWEAFALAGASIVPIPVDAHGLNVDALRRAADSRRIRAVYTTPHRQFPTTVTLTAPRRLALLELAAERGFAIVEDDYDHEFTYDGRPVLPLTSVDTRGVAIYIGTLSKVLAPALRLGFVCAPRDFVGRLTAYRSFIDLQGDAVLESAVAELLDQGMVQRHVGKVRRLYRARRDVLTAALRRSLGTFLSFVEPSGGTAIWVRTRDARTMARWAARSRELGVVFDAGRVFSVGGQPLAGARLGFACLDEGELARAARILIRAAALSDPG